MSTYRIYSSVHHIASDDEVYSDCVLGSDLLQLESLLTLYFVGVGQGSWKITSDCIAILMSFSAEVALSFTTIYAALSHETERRMGGWF